MHGIVGEPVQVLQGAVDSNLGGKMCMLELVYLIELFFLSFGNNWQKFAAFSVFMNHIIVLAYQCLKNYINLIYVL